MASEKKILMFDETTGMLSREAITAYINNELSPSLRQDVEDFLAKDEMHRDIMEGLMQVRDKKQVEKAIHSINEKIAERTGAGVSSGDVSFDLPEVFTDYKKIAAIVTGVLLLSGVVITVMLLRESSPGIASNEKESVQKNVEIEPAKDFKTEEKISMQEADTSAGLLAAVADSSVKTDSQITAGGIAELGDAEGAVAGNYGVETAMEEKRPQAAKKSKAEDKSAPDVGAGAGSFTAPAAATDDISIAESNAPASDTVTAFREVSRMAAVPVEQAPAASVEMPEFPGGEAGLRKYIRDNLIYPEEAKDNRVQGKVEVEFYVGTTGRVKSIRVVKGVNKEINTEAVRLIANMPKWKPGKLEGKPATLQRQLTIDFAID